MAHFSEMTGSGDINSSSLSGARVTDAAGHQGLVISTEQAQGKTRARIQFDDGFMVVAEADLLTLQAEGLYRLPLTFTIPSGQAGTSRMSVPVMEEQIQVGKRLVDTGRGVRLHKTVTEHEQTLDEPLRHDELMIERVPVGRTVTTAEPPQVRYEGDTLVVPVLEEVLVVQKQLMLKEEVHITRHQHHIREPQSVMLRSEQVTVERFDREHREQA